MGYQYWTIRFVPDIARGEFTNIGIVCGQDGADWAVRFDTRYVRNHGTFGSDLTELAPWIADFQRTIDGHARPPLADGTVRVTSAWINHVRSRQANSVQLSTPASIDVSSAADGVALLYPHLVQRSTAKRRSTITRRNLRAEVRDTLETELEFSLGINLFMKPLATIGKQRGIFDIARFAAGEDFLTNVWAFDILDVALLEREIQSWNFLVGMLRQDGASLHLDNSSSRSFDSTTVIEVVYHASEPVSADRKRLDVLDAAMEAWNRNQVIVRTLDEYRAEAGNSNLATVI